MEKLLVLIAVAFMFGIGLSIGGYNPELLKNFVKIGLWCAFGGLAILTAVAIFMRNERFVILTGQGVLVSVLGLIFTYWLL